MTKPDTIMEARAEDFLQRAIPDADGALLEVLAAEFLAIHNEAMLAASPPAPSVGDDLTADLMRFYDVKTVPELIAAQDRHIKRLQEKNPVREPIFPASPRHG